METLAASTSKSCFDLQIDAVELTDEDLEEVTGSWGGFGWGRGFGGFGFGRGFGFGGFGFGRGFGFGGFFPGFGGGFFPGFGWGGGFGCGC
jgi:hypothetical protein